VARFPIYTDADVRGSLVKGLKGRGWDVVRAIDIYAKRTPDAVHFEKAVELGRVLVTNDQPAIDIANHWLREARQFPGMITWPQEHYLRMSDGDIIRKFEELAEKDQPLDPDYPIVHFNPD
jgi:hypothetical protein